MKKSDAILTKLMRILLPGGSGYPGALDIKSDERAVVILNRLPWIVVWFARLMLLTFNQVARFFGKGSFLKQSPEDCEKTILAFEKMPGPLGRALLPIKLLAVSTYLENPKIIAQLEAGLPKTCEEKTFEVPPPKTLPALSGSIQTKIIEETFDVIVIGSGAGGAPVARELAQAGWSVAIVEEGSVVDQKDMKELPLDRVQRYYRNHGATATFGNPLVLLPLGRAVGGTTVINSGTCFRTPDKVIDRWQKEFGLSISPEELIPYYEDVEKTLGVAEPGWDILGGNAAILRDGAEKLGLSHRPLLRNAATCRGCGECALGCPSGGKKSVHLNYLPQAVAAGAQIFAESRVDKIIKKNSRAVGVSGSFLDKSGKKTGVSFLLHAKRGVVVSGGTVFTPGILRRSGLGRSGLGTGLRLHPCTAVSAQFDKDIYAWRGVMQSYMVDAFKHEDMMIEATFAPPSMSYVEGSLSLPGTERMRMISHFKNLVTVGVLVSDSSSGRVHSVQTSGMPFLSYFLNQYDRERVLKAMAHTSDILFAAGAREVYPMIDGVHSLKNPDEAKRCFAKKWPASALKLTAYHPMGTARMGHDRGGILDDDCRYKGIDRLVVADASVFPSSLTVNPQVTIMAMATRAARKILESW